MGYTNSSLINYTKISPNKTSPRNHVIDTITIHCMAGNLSVESCGNLFASSSKQASSNYGIGSDGRIALYVDEKDRSWGSSNSANDNRAITIEVANDGGEPDWHVSDKAISSLINLITDICKRNNIKELKWKGDKSLIGQVDKQNMTVHRWFAAKACPGDYLYNKHSYIAEEVNKKLKTNSTPTSTSSSMEIYRIRKTWADTSSQIGAYSNLDYAKAACKAGYSVFDSKGNVVYPITTNTNSATSSSTTSATSSPNTYTVVKNDTLSSIGTKFNVNWKTIADLNGIKSPYVINIGQVLKLPTYATSTTTTSATATNNLYKVKITATSGLNIRSGAGTTYSKVGAIPYNTQVTVTSETNGWGKVSYNNISGYISLEYTKKV